MIAYDEQIKFTLLLTYNLWKANTEAEAQPNLLYEREQTSLVLA